MGSSVLVTGGTGQLGREVVARLLSGGHRARVASRGPRPTDAETDLPTDEWATVEWAKVEWLTGNGLDAALDGVDAVVHCASGSVKGEWQTLTVLLSALRRRPAVTTDPTRIGEASPPHLIYVSIVGVDRIPLSYYRAKLTAEQRIEASGLPHSIVRATQFHSLITTYARALTRLPVVSLVPKGLAFQPTAVGPVADRLVELALGQPRGRVDHVAGPQVTSLTDLVREYLAATGTRRRVVEIPIGGRILAAFRAGHHTAPGLLAAGQTFAEYLTETVGRSDAGG